MIPKLFFCALLFSFLFASAPAFLGPCGAVQAQPNLGPFIVAMGNTGATAAGIWSINANPAGITTVSRPCLSLGCSTPAGLPEMATQDFLFAFPAQRNRFGIGVERYGFSAFNLLNTGLVYGKQFGTRLSIATRFNFHQVSAAEYGAVSTSSFDLGFRYVLKDNVFLGAYISNPTQQEYPVREQNFRVYSAFAGGLAWQSSGQVLLAFNVAKEPEQQADFRTGIAYTPSAMFTFSGGISLKPLRHYAGFQVIRKSLAMDFAASSDPQLGYHPQIAMSYAW